MSKSSSSTSSSSKTNDNRVASGGDINAPVATGGATINYLSDSVANNALSTAAALGAQSMNLASDTVTSGLQAVLQLADQQAQVTEAARVGNNNFAEGVTQDAIAAAQQAAQPDLSVVNSFTDAAKYAAIGLLAAGVVIFLNKKK